MPQHRQDRDEDSGKGAVEQDRPDQPTNVSMTGQSGHRDQDPLLKSSDSDFPEAGTERRAQRRATWTQPARR